MNLLIKYLKTLAIPLISIIIMALFLSISNYIGFKTNKTIILIIMSIIMFISGFYLSKQINNKKYLNGLILGIITSLIFFILSLLFKKTYTINTLIYYLIIILSSMFGSMLNSVKQK